VGRDAVPNSAIVASRVKLALHVSYLEGRKRLPIISLMRRIQHASTRLVAGSSQAQRPFSFASRSLPFHVAEALERAPQAADAQDRGSCDLLVVVDARIYRHSGFRGPTSDRRIRPRFFWR
jgi:hypothetical protein